MKISNYDSNLSKIMRVVLLSSFTLILLSCNVFSTHSILIEANPLAIKILQQELNNKQEYLQDLKIELRENSISSVQAIQTNNKKFIKKIIEPFTRKRIDMYLGFDKNLKKELHEDSTNSKVYIAIPYIKDSIVLIKNSLSNIPDNLSIQNLNEIIHGNSTISFKTRNKITSVNLKFYSPNELSSAKEFVGESSRTIPNEYSVFMNTISNSIYLNTFNSLNEVKEILTKEKNSILILNLSYYVYLLETQSFGDKLSTEIISIVGEKPSLSIPSQIDMNNNYFNIKLNPNYPFHTYIYLILNQKTLYRKSNIKLLQYIFTNEHMYQKSNYIYRDEEQILESKRQLDKNYQLYHNSPLIRIKEQGDIF